MTDPQSKEQRVELAAFVAEVRAKCASQVGSVPRTYYVITALAEENEKFRSALEELCRKGRCPIAEEALGL